jgi:hypothetical protein
MNNAAIAVVAFLLGNGVGVGVLYATGEFAPLEAAPVPAVAVAKIEPPAPVAAPPVAPPSLPAPVVAAAPTPTPAPVPVPAAPVAPQPAPAVAAIVPSPPREAEPRAPNGKLIVAGMGDAALSVSADKVRKGKRVSVPLFKPEGLVTAHSPDGTFSLDIRYKADGDGLKASIDCSPMALLTAQGQTATHLSGVAVAGAPVRVDVKGGSAGEFSLILSHQK